MNGATEIRRIKLQRRGARKDPNDFELAGMLETAFADAAAEDKAGGNSHREAKGSAGDGKDRQEHAVEGGPLIDLGEIPKNFDVRAVPTRPWVVVDRALCGYVTILAAPPGCGKTSFEIASAISVASGVSYTGEMYRKSGKAWVYANEEDKDEMHRRFGAFCLLHGVNPNSLRDNLRLSSGYGRSLIIAKRIESTGDVIPTPVVTELIRALKDIGCIYFAVDPLISTHRVNENSNTDLESVMEQWRRVSFEANCAIEIPTHIPKAHDGPEAHAGNMSAVRGASAIAGAARNISTLARMSGETAKRFGIDEREALDLVRLDRAKGNYSPPADAATWLQMCGVCLDNDPERPDWVGAARAYPHELKEVDGIRDSAKEGRLSELRVAIRMLDIHPGQRVPLSSVIDEIAGQSKISKSWIQDNLSQCLPKDGTAAGRQEKFSWSKEPGKTGKKFIYRALP